MQKTPNLPLVSIAVATYNGAQFLVAQLDTLVAQSYPNIEIIVSDDGSTDGTLETLELYAKNHATFFVYKNEWLHGIKKNFENALKYCNGTYIAFSDQDDIWMLDKIEKLVNAIGDYALVYHDSLFVDLNGNSLNKSFASIFNCYSGNDSRAFLFTNSVSGHALMFHCSMISIALPFPSAMHHDWWLAFRAADNGGIIYVNEVFVHYRQHEKSTTDFLMIKKDKLKDADIKEMELAWYEACEKAPGTHQNYIQKWLRLYKEKTSKKWSLSFFIHNLSAMQTLYFMRKKSWWSNFFLVIRSSRANK